MGYFAGTPEAHQARLGRKDSKNFATTCRGINTATGKQCRRGLSKSPNAPTSGIVTFVNGEETFFCWQHKEQAKDMVMKHTSSWQVRREQAGRTSLDTLVETVEVMVGTSSSGGRNGRTPVIAATATATAASGRKDSVGLLAVGPEAAKISPSSLLSNPSSPPSASGPRPRNSFLSFLAMLFSSCFGSRKKKRNPNLFPDATYSALAIIPEDGGTNHTKHTKPGRKNRLSNQHVQFDTTPMGPPLPHMSATKPMPSAMATTPYHGGGFQGKPGTTSITHQRPPLFSAIPKHLSPKTALLLQQELLKPFSSSDQPGYIYIFWLQDKPTGADPLQDTSPSTDKGKRRSSAPTNLDEAMDATASNSKGTSKRILFKIGRAVSTRLPDPTEGFLILIFQSGQCSTPSPSMDYAMQL